jgi:uncharacterized protein
MPDKKQKLDLLARLRIRELVLMGLISVTAVLANLPQEYVQERLGVNPDFLLAVLACVVIVGLFLYLKFFFFLAVVLLIAGANMPDQIAEGLNVSKLPIMLALVALVGIALVNAVVKVLPTGLEPRPREKSAEGTRALFYAIEKNNLNYAQKVLSMHFDPSLHHDNGYTPLAYAAMKGSHRMVELLLRNGADPTQRTRDGDTPVELALRLGHAELAEQIRRARRSYEGEDEPLPQAQA